MLDRTLLALANSAAPVRITVIMVRLLMICITEVNQLDFKFGLNFARVTTLTGAPGNPSRLANELRSHSLWITFWM